MSSEETEAGEDDRMGPDERALRHVRDMMLDGIELPPGGAVELEFQLDGQWYLLRLKPIQPPSSPIPSPNPEGDTP